MNRIQNTLLALVAAASLTACTDVRREESPVLHEDGIVTKAEHTPSHYGMKMGLNRGMTGMGKLKYGMHYGTIPDEYDVAFDAQHDFTSKDPKLYERFKDKEGAPVDITYTEIYNTTYDDTNHDGTKEVIERVLVRYDFIDAVLKPATNNVEKQ